MTDNLSFLQHEHKCVVCKSNVDMQKVNKYVTECMRMAQHSRARYDDPVIVDDFGNDVSIACCFECYLKYLHIDP